jgi:hypothetical protein
MIFVVIFLLSLFRPCDLDLGGHLRYGEYFIQNKLILREDLYSFGLPGYPWTNIAWGFDILEYTLFTFFGFAGLTVTGALIITLIYYLVDRIYKPKPWVRLLIYPASLWVAMHIVENSFRGQLISALFLAFVVFFRSGWWLPPLFLFWSNLNGQFILGLGIAVFLYRSKLVFLAFLATLVHPFGFNIYKQALDYFFNPASSVLQEWAAPVLFSPEWTKLIIWGVLVLMAAFYTRSRLCFLSLGLLVLSFLSRRYFLSLVIVSLPIVVQTLNRIKFKLVAFNSKPIFIATYFFLAVFLIHDKFVTDNVFKMDWEIYCERCAACSPKGAEFILAKNLNNQGLLTTYHWGEWLIWRYPQIKPYVDGRMDHWRDFDNYPFQTYLSFLTDPPKIDTSNFKTVFIIRSSKLYDYLKISKNWKVIFEDNVSAIFVR